MALFQVGSLLGSIPIRVPPSFGFVKRDPHLENRPKSALVDTPIDPLKGSLNRDLN